MACLIGISSKNTKTVRIAPIQFIMVCDTPSKTYIHGLMTVSG